MRSVTPMRLLLLLFACCAAGSTTSAETLNFAGELAVGDGVYEESGEYFDRYKVNLKAGQFIDLYAESEAFDSYLIIFPPEGDQIDIDDYYTDDVNAGLLFVARESGVYTFHVTSVEPKKTGAYTFTCIITESRVETAHQGELTEQDDVSWKGGEFVDRYELVLKPNEERVLTVDSDDFAVYLTIHRPDGTVNTVYGYPAATTVEAGEAGGQYTLVVTSQKPREVGAYRLEVRSLVEAPEQ